MGPGLAMRPAGRGWWGEEVGTEVERGLEAGVDGGVDEVQRAGFFVNWVWWEERFSL